MIRSLEYYIRQIQGCDQVFNNNNNNNNNHGIPHATATTPLLQPGTVNRIIFYPGCFNPPHIGHLALLQHVFEHTRRDMNIIAAVIFPLDDESLAEKLGPQRPRSRTRSDDVDMILTKDQRVKLWRGHGLADYIWVYDGSAASWVDFQARLVQDVSRGGFELEFSNLCGPDHLHDIYTTPPMEWGCSDLLVSDIGRDAELTELMPSGVTSMKQLPFCTPWKRPVVDCESIRKTAESQVSWVVSGLSIMNSKSGQGMLRRDPSMVDRMTDETYRKLVTSASRVWICHRTDWPSSTIRFIPKPEEDEMPNLSSSMIRNLIKDSQSGSGKIIDMKLRDMVLHSDILSEIVAS